MEGNVIKRDIWLLWEVKGTQVYLRAVDESEEIVRRHKRMCENERDSFFEVEKRETNHLYGARGL